MKQVKREVDKIIIHCTATPENRQVTVEDVTKWHKVRGFKTIGYHYIIGINGEIWEGRPLEEEGAHCKGHNKNSIGIAYVGGLDNQKNPKDTRNDKQKNAMYTLVAELLNKYPKAKLHCHNEFANKACPSFKIEEF